MHAISLYAFKKTLMRRELNFNLIKPNGPKHQARSGHAVRSPGPWLLAFRRLAVKLEPFKGLTVKLQWAPAVQRTRTYIRSYPHEFQAMDQIMLSHSTANKGLPVSL
jgi:hypothetical protein